MTSRNTYNEEEIIEQLHDRLQDDGISEELITHVEDRLGHDRRYGIDPEKIREICSRLDRDDPAWKESNQHNTITEGRRTGK